MSKQNLIEEYLITREKTETLCKPLAIEDYVIQSNEDVSPPKWHLAHTTWFFETFVLLPYFKNYHLYHPLFQYLFNSYYQTIGYPYPRIQRGLLSRPTVKTIYHYRHYVDEQIINYLNQSMITDTSLASLIKLGMHHEQQHQELLLMDIKHNFSIDPSFPIYQENIKTPKQANIKKMQFIYMEGGVINIGHTGDEFCFDNELPQHQLILRSYQIANRLITNAEYLEFIESGGYKKPEYWLADGWNYLQNNHWQRPLYWQHIDNEWYIFTLHGLQKLNPIEPVSHVSYYEADAFARFSNCRLPSEAEWEHLVLSKNINLSDGNFLETSYLHPTTVEMIKNDTAQQLFGDLWEWTASPYCPYPGYKPLRGSLGEYNGKFMSNQMVLRGGSCVTPKTHMRVSYRNFFQPNKRWQFCGIRLASDV